MRRDKIDRGAALALVKENDLACVRTRDSGSS
jgi:hypothetical protein